MGRHVWKKKLAVCHWNVWWVLILLSCSKNVHCTIVWAFLICWSTIIGIFKKGILLREWIDIKFVRICYVILHYTIKLVVHHPHTRLHMYHTISSHNIYYSSSCVALKLENIGGIYSWIHKHVIFGIYYDHIHRNDSVMSAAEPM